MKSQTPAELRDAHTKKIKALNRKHKAVVSVQQEAFITTIKVEREKHVEEIAKLNERLAVCSDANTNFQEENEVYSNSLNSSNEFISQLQDKLTTKNQDVYDLKRERLILLNALDKLST